MKHNSGQGNIIKNNKNKNLNKITGNRGEIIAVEFLLNQDYRIIERNYQRKIGEIDIIALKNNIIHFVEVKSVTRETSIIYNSQNNEYLPEEQVNFEKMLHMKRTIELFMFENDIFESEVQINVITVTFFTNGETPRINFIENVY